jgi:hypothetical protein
VAAGPGGPAHPRPALSPPDPGKDERFHRTLKGEVLDGRTFADLDAAQLAVDRWREVYNRRRPHQAIGMNTPASRYRMSPRSMPKSVPAPEYEPEAFVRKVHDGGWLNFKGRIFNCSKAFAGRRVALRATDTDGVFDLCYRTHRLAQINLRQTN